MSRPIRRLLFHFLFLAKEVTMNWRAIVCVRFAFDNVFFLECGRVFSFFFPLPSDWGGSLLPLLLTSPNHWQRLPQVLDHATSHKSIISDALSLTHSSIVNFAFICLQKIFDTSFNSKYFERLSI